MLLLQKQSLEREQKSNLYFVKQKYLSLNYFFHLFKIKKDFSYPFLIQIQIANLVTIYNFKQYSSDKNYPKFKSPRYSITCFLQNVCNRSCLILPLHQINVSNFNFYKSLFIFKNLRSKNNKYFYLLQYIISEPVFLMYVYKITVHRMNNLIFENFIFDLNKLNINWFKNLGLKLKKNKFKWNFNSVIYLLKNYQTKHLLDIHSLESVIVNKAIYLIFLEIYDMRLNYFSNYSYGSRFHKNFHSVIYDIKSGWKNINWFVTLSFKKIFSIFTINKLFQLLKEYIQDKMLFSLLYKKFKVEIQNNENVSFSKKNFKWNDAIIFLFFNIYLTSLDKYVEKLVRQNYIHKKWQKTSLNFCTKIKYIRYINCVVFGIQGSKKSILELKRKILNFLKNDLFLEKNKVKIQLGNVFKSPLSFLSYRIYYVKKKYKWYLKNRMPYKRVEISHIFNSILKTKQSIFLKNLMDKIWHEFKFYSNNSRDIPYLLKSDNEYVTEKKLFNSFKLNKRQKFYKFIQHLFLQMRLNIRNYFKFETFLNNQWKILQKSKHELFFKKVILDKKYVLKLFLRYYNSFLCIDKYPYSYLNKKFKQKLSDSHLFKSIFYLEQFPLKIKLKNIYIKNKLNFLVNITKHKKDSLYNFKNNLTVKSLLLFSKEIYKINQEGAKISVNADVSSIYEKLKNEGILQLNKMKVDSYKSVLLWDDYKIIVFFSNLAKNVLYHFLHCDNISKVKSIVYYYIKLSLVMTLKQKHTISSINNVFKIYGTNIGFINPCEKKYRISFVTKSHLNPWLKSFIKKI